MVLEDSDIDWQGTIERNEVTKKRKIDRYRRKKLLEAKVAKKAKHMLGLGPIRRDSVSYFHNIVGDLEDAKKMAIDEFLSEYLQLNKEERKDFDIIDTTFAKNEDDLIYVTFRDFESVKEIRRRVAIIRNDEIKVRIFIPPQFWTRYRFLSNYCADERAKNSNFKTMIRFTDTDMEVLFKDKSNEDQYNAVPLKDIENEVGKFLNLITHCHGSSESIVRREPRRRRSRRQFVLLPLEARGCKNKPVRPPPPPRVRLYLQKGSRARTIVIRIWTLKLKPLKV